MPAVALGPVACSRKRSFPWTSSSSVCAAEEGEYFMLCDEELVERKKIGLFANEFPHSDNHGNRSSLRQTGTAEASRLVYNRDDNSMLPTSRVILSYSLLFFICRLSMYVGCCIRPQLPHFIELVEAGVSSSTLSS